MAMVTPATAWHTLVLQLREATMLTEPNTAPGADLGIDVRPMAGYIGAEIHGVDLRETLSPAAVAAIRSALLQWKVVFFRDQFIDQAQHLAFTRSFGEPTPAHPTLPAVFADFPEILLLDNQMHARVDAPNIESRWHTDVTFLANPPMASILRGVVVPPYGGDTQFTNLAVAYAKLSAPLRDLCDTLHAVHHNVIPIERGELSSELRSQFMSREIRAVHPVVRVHPETGERVLFVNPNFTSHIVELSRRESGHLLALLYEHMAGAHFTCRFRWEPGSLAFWDNRATAHLVPTDIPAGLHRSMQRITLAGDVTVGVDGSTGRALDVPSV
jgi:alpha-ketoglutarate-dependent sulfate ester dioxygenase